MPGPGYYRHPTIHGDTVVFVSEDDLWSVPSAGGVAIRRTRDDQVARLRCGILDAAHDLVEIRVGDVMHDHPDDRHGALEQAACEGVGHVVQFARGGQDALARGVADRVVNLAHDARRGRGRDAGKLGDLGDRSHQMAISRSGRRTWARRAR